MKLRMTLLGALAVLATTLGLVVPAAAANAAPAAPTTGTISTTAPCTIGGVANTCTVTVTAFKNINGVLNAVGTVTGPGISSPIPFTTPVTVTDPPGSCQILDLTLGPLHLDLLGLVVDLNQVHLTITAQQGSGNLLGNLLCAVAHLLDNTGNITAPLTNLLNQILAVLGRV